MTMQNKRLVIVDMNFTWPPDGGAPIDLMNVMTRLSKLHDTTLILPRLDRLTSFLRRPWPLSKTKFFVRGEIRSNLPPEIKVKCVDFDAIHFSPKALAYRLQIELEDIQPDYLVLADSWYFKPDLVLALEKWKPILFLYAHEMMCLKGNGLLFRNEKVCDNEFLNGSRETYKACLRCATQFYVSYPSPRWVFEYLRSKAYLPNYQTKCIRSFALAKAVVVKNQFIAHRIRPYVSGRLVVAPPGIDTERFKSVREKGNSADPFQILISGRMKMRSKGLHVALNALQNLWKRRQDFRLTVLSDGVKTNPFPFIKYLSWLPYDQVTQLYQKADLLISPSIGPESFGLVAQEAMACGLPVIGTNIGGMPDCIANGETGFLVPPNDPLAMEKKVEWFIDHRTEAREMGLKGKEKAAKEFSIDTIFTKHYLPLFLA